MGRLTRIDYRFPERVPGARAFFAALVALLSPVPGVGVRDWNLHLTSSRPTRALPSTTLALASTPTPEIVFATAGAIDLALGALGLRSEPLPTRHDISPRDDRNATAPYATAPSNTAAGEQPTALPMDVIAERLAGRVTHVDHTGVNLPIAALDSNRWEELLRVLAEGAALYRYPGGEPWPFILPATGEEFATDIRTFATGRWPKFELVYDSWATCPVLQFSLGTALTREEAEARFPALQGLAFPDLGHIFRTVYASHPWPGLLIRFDLNYQGPVTEWDTGEWLVAVGGRIR